MERVYLKKISIILRQTGEVFAFIYEVDKK